jgi:hypothetical protein
MWLRKYKPVIWTGVSTGHHLMPDYLGVNLRNVLSSLFVVLLLASTSFAGQDARYPQGPNEKVTPGSVCKNPDRYRYPEKVAYCERNVESSLKRDIIAEYDRELGYRIQSMDRQAFKIDHYIPLCMGGSNSRDNLWPQHKSVFEKTDLLEQVLCEKMAQGVLRQVQAIDLIKDAKNNLEKSEEILSYAQGL